MSFFRKKIWVIMSLGFFNALGLAQTKPPLTIEQAVEEALAQNPHLKAVSAETEAAKAKIGIARSLDDPMVGIEFDTVPLNTSDVTQGMSTDYEISQKLPFPTKLAARSKAAKKTYGAWQSNYEAEKIDIVVQTEHAYHDLYLLEKSLQINRELQGLFQRLSGSEQAKYAVSHNTSQNFLKSKVELEKLKSEAELLKVKQAGAQASLNILRNKDPKEEIFLAELPKDSHPLPSYESLKQKVLEKHPELNAAQLQLEAAQANVSIARQEAWIPDLQARFGYNQRNGQIDAWTASAMINIPFLWGKNRKVLKEAKAMRQVFQQSYLGRKNERLAILQEAAVQLESTEKSHQLFKTKILPSARLAFQSAQAAYQTGKDDFLSLIDAARSLKEAQFGALEAFVNYHQAITHLKWAIGENV